MKWNWKKRKAYSDEDAFYSAKCGNVELQVWQGFEDEEHLLWLTAVDVKVGDEYATAYPKAHKDFQKAKRFAEQYAESWFKKLNTAFKED